MTASVFAVTKGKHQLLGGKVNKVQCTLVQAVRPIGGEGSASRPGRSLPPGKTRYSLYRRLGGPHGQSGQVRKISPPTGIRSPDRPARRQSLYRLSYSAHSVQTVRPIGGEGSASRPGRSLPPGKTRYSLYRRLGGPQGRSGQVWIISPPPGFDPRTVQPVAQSLYRLSYSAHSGKKTHSEKNKCAC